jgi:hypothetical protein
LGIVTDYLTSRTRPLTTDEIEDAKRVYQRTIKYDFVKIADDLGGGGREYTEPSGGSLDTYIVHLGSTGYASTVDPNTRATLIHELCHVWQGMHHFIAWGYVVNSLLHQAVSGSDAYVYTPGKPWGMYNVEQQAQMVEDWYRSGLPNDGPLYKYITGNIRCPIRSWLEPGG